MQNCSIVFSCVYKLYNIGFYHGFGLSSTFIGFVYFIIYFRTLWYLMFLVAPPATRSSPQAGSFTLITLPSTLYLVYYSSVEKILHNLRFRCADIFRMPDSYTNLQPYTRLMRRKMAPPVNGKYRSAEGEGER